jgi:hypothetical protein
LFSLELSRRLRGTRATSNCVSPGFVRTNLSRNVDTSKLPPNAKSVPEGAATSCYVATSPALGNTTGEYFSNCNPAPQGEYQTDAAMAAKLWDVSTEITRKYLMVEAATDSSVERDWYVVARKDLGKRRSPGLFRPVG